MKKSLIQTIKELIRQGEEINAEKLTFMLDDLIDEEKKLAIQSTAPKNQKLTYVRNVINSAIRAAGFKVLNTRKNTYKPVTAYQDFMRYRKKKFDRMLKDFYEIKKLDKEMLAQGFPVPVEFSPEMEEIENAAEATKRKAYRAI